MCQLQHSPMFPAEHVIIIAGDNRVPFLTVLEAASPLNGAMDNFKQNKSTLAEPGSSHDTILIKYFIQ